MALQINHVESNKRQCTRCHGWYSSGFFRKNPWGKYTCPKLRTVCKGCETTERTERKKPNRFIQKANWTIAHHAKRFGMKSKAFKEEFGWDISRVAHLLQHAYDNTCNYCRRPYAEMDGRNDITLDIRDRNASPYLETNVVPCCRTCNMAKGTMSPDEWGAQLADWRTFEERQRIQTAQQLMFEFVLEKVSGTWTRGDAAEYVRKMRE